MNENCVPFFVPKESNKRKESDAGAQPSEPQIAPKQYIANPHQLPSGQMETL